MRSAFLSVGVGGDRALLFTLTDGAQSAEFEGATPEWDDTTTDGPEWVDSLIPPALKAALRAWSAVDSGSTLLLVDAVGPAAEIRWELLPTVARLDQALVVRLLSDQPSARGTTAGTWPPRLLAAGWSMLSQRAWMKGIEREIAALASLGNHAGVEVNTMLGPTINELASAYAGAGPTVLHLVPAAIDGTNLFVDSDPDNPWVDATDLIGQMIAGSRHRPLFTMLNSCEGTAAAQAVCRSTQAPVLAWGGMIDDELAADFATGFYTRLLAGHSLIDAVARFGSSWDVLGQDVRPVLWVTAEADLNSSFTPPSQPATRRSRPQGGRRSPQAPAPVAEVEDSNRPPVEVQMELAPAVNPALLVNNEPVVRRLAIRSDRFADGACLEVSCDTGGRVSTWRQSLNLTPDFRSVDHVKLAFPALYELIEDKAGRREITISASVRHPDLPAVEVTQSALWMALDEWMDSEDTWRFIGAFVQPQNEGVLEVIDEADRELQSIDRPTSAFAGYQSGRPEDVVMQVRALYQTVRDSFGVSYINPPGVGIYTRQRSAGQRVRDAAAVIQRRRGTCHDLSLLLASLMEHVGIYPLVILIPGHTFVGFWNDDVAHERYWERVDRDPLKRGKTGEGQWLMAEAEDLRSLHQERLVTLVESTELTNKSQGFEGACEIGRTTLFDDGAGFDVAVDVAASRQKIRPL